MRSGPAMLRRAASLSGSEQNATHAELAAQADRAALLTTLNARLRRLEAEFAAMRRQHAGAAALRRKQIDIEQLRSRIAAIGGAVQPPSSSELSMIEMQSVIGQRGVVLQMTTNLLRATNDSTKSIIGNIR